MAACEDVVSSGNAWTGKRRLEVLPPHRDALQVTARRVCIKFRKEKTIGKAP